MRKQRAQRNCRSSGPRNFPVGYRPPKIEREAGAAHPMGTCRTSSSSTSSLAATLSTANRSWHSNKTQKAWLRHHRSWPKTLYITMSSYMPMHSSCAFPFAHQPSDLHHLVAATHEPNILSICNCRAMALETPANRAAPIVAEPPSL